MEEALQTLTAYAEQLIGRPVDPDTNMFVYGFNSIQAAQISAFLYRQYGAVIPLDKMLREPFLRSWTADIQQTDPDLQQTDQYAETANIPLTGAQTGIWLHDTFSDDDTFTIYMTQQINGNADRELLEKILCDLIAAKKIFSMQVTTEKGLPVFTQEKQAYQPEIISETVSPDSADARDQIRRIAGLQNGQLYRFVIAPHENGLLLIVAMHHLISDEQTMHILFQEIWDTYADRRQGIAHEISADNAFPQFCAGFHTVSDDVEAWKMFYAQYPLFQTETLCEPAAYVTERCVIPPEVIGQLQQNGMTLFSGIFTAVLRSLCESLKTETVCIGTAVSAAGPQYSDKCGMYVHEHVLPMTAKAGEEFRQTADRISERLLFAYAHNSICFDEMMRKRIVSNKLAELQDHIVLTVLEAERADRQMPDGVTVHAPQYVKQKQRADFDILIEHVNGEYTCEISHFCNRAAENAAKILFRRFSLP